MLDDLKVLQVAESNSSLSVSKKVYRRLIGLGPQERLIGLLAKVSKSSPKRPIRILDIGSGGARYWLRIFARIDDEVILDLLDPVVPNWSFNEINLPGKQIRHIHGLAPEHLSEISPDSYDIVVAFDLIEHLSKADGYMLLYQIDRVTRGYSIIFTPNGMVWQPPSENNPFNAHISGWTPSELKALGWEKIRGHTGWKQLFGPYGVSIFPGSIGLLAHTSGSLVSRLPRLAFSFSAIRYHGSWESYIHDGITHE